ncbi:MAG: leucine-rich repeat domain-containing protein [Alphaproteobacteria bacterium]|nr:leucine-rich repeat domain-containing protein [Alphaproteobacteria bacterium]
MKNYLVALSLFTFSMLPSTLLAVNKSNQRNNTGIDQKEQSKKRERDENDQLLNDQQPKQKKIQTPNEIILNNLTADKSTLNFLDETIQEFINTFQSLRFDNNFEESDKEEFIEETLKTNNPLFILQMIKKIIDNRETSIDAEFSSNLINSLNDITNTEDCASLIKKTKSFDACEEAWDLYSYSEFIDAYDLLKNKYNKDIAFDALEQIKNLTSFQLYGTTYKTLIDAFLNTNQNIFEQIDTIKSFIKNSYVDQEFFYYFIELINNNYQNEPIIKNIQTINDLIEIGNVKKLSEKNYFELMSLLNQIDKKEFDFFIENIKKLITHEFNSLKTYCNIIKIINCIKASHLNKEINIKNNWQFFDKIQNIFPEINKENFENITNFLSKITTTNNLNFFEYAQIIEFLVKKSINHNEKFSNFMNHLNQSYEKYDWNKNIYSKLTLVEDLTLFDQANSNLIFHNKFFINKHNNILEKITDITSFIFLKSLDIRYNKLTSLPESIKNLENLEELHLDENNLKTIPDSIKHLKKLRILCLSSNKITSLPDWIGDLENLEELYLGKNKITTLPDSIQKLQKLRILRLDCNKITSLPDWIGDLENLETLHLGRDRFSSTKHTYGNKIATLPTSIKNLKKLKILNISYNNITFLPNEIGNLKNLTNLDLSANQLTILPNVIGNLNNLKELNLSNNKLTTLPDSVGNLNNLTELNLSNNKLTILPDSVGNLSNLTKLYLSQNALSNLPNTTKNLIKLTELYVNANNITSFPNVICSLRNLNDLNLSNNKLETIDDSIENLINLKYFDIKNNEITSIPNSIDKLKKLIRLDLGNNKLISLPDSIGELSSLDNLTLNDNNITNLPDSFSKLTSLRFLGLYNNGLTSFPLIITQLYNLQQLVIGKNEISSLPDSMSNLSYLHRLIIHKCNFTTFPDVILTLPQLDDLNLDDNQIKTIPNEISNLTKLYRLSLNNNLIKELPCTVKKLDSLAHLYLGGNKFTTFPEAIPALRNLQELYLNDNQIKTLPIEIANPYRLRILNLCNNQIDEISYNIRKLNQLEELNISLNKLTNFPEAITNFTNLNTLYLGTNQIKVIPEEIGNLTNLKKLSFYNNQIETIPDTIKNLTKLNSLYLGRNKLKHIPNTIGMLSNLKELRLHDNLLTFVPSSLTRIKTLTELNLNNNPDLMHKGENGIALGKKELRKYFKNSIQLNKPMLTANKTEKDVFEFMDEFSSRINHNQFASNILPEIIVDKIFDYPEMCNALAEILTQLNLQDPNEPGYICYEIITNDHETYAEQEISNLEKINLSFVPRLFKYIDTLYGIISQDNVDILQMYPEQISDTQKSLTFNFKSILNEEDLDVKALQFITLVGGLLHCATGQSEGNNAVNYAAQGQYYTNDFKYNLKRFLAAKKNEYFTTTVLQKGFNNNQNVHLISKYRDALKPILGLSTAITSFYERIGPNQQDVFYGNKWNVLQTFYDLVTPDLMINWVFEAAETQEDQRDYNKQFKRDVPKEEKEEYLQNVKKKIKKNKMLRPFITGEICAYLINEKLMIGKKNWEKYFTENPCKIGNHATLTREGAKAILIHEAFIIEDPEDDEMIIDDNIINENYNNNLNN